LNQIFAENAELLLALFYRLLALDIFEKTLNDQLIDWLVIIGHNVALIIFLILAVSDWTGQTKMALTNQ